MPIKNSNLKLVSRWALGLILFTPAIYTVPSVKKTKTPPVPELPVQSTNMVSNSANPGSASANSVSSAETPVSAETVLAAPTALTAPITLANEVGANLPTETPASSLTGKSISSKKYHGRYKPRKSPLKKLLTAKEFNDLNADEVSARTKEHLDNQDYRAAALCVERELALCKNHNQICKLRLTRADIWLAAGETEKAAAGYREFIAQYPSHPQTEYAKYKLIKILFDAMPQCERDQSGTSEALQTAREFLTNQNYTKYSAEVQKISERCYCQLFDSEVKKFEFYVNHRQLVAASKRLKYLEEHYPEFTLELAELKKWLTATEKNQRYVLPENLRVKRSKKHYYGAKHRNYGAMF